MAMIYLIRVVGVLMLLGLAGFAWAETASPDKEPGNTLKAGDEAPDFTLPDAQGKPVTLSGFRGQYVVLYFYPKDNTPGCTQEACDFRNSAKNFQDLKAVIIGVSRDSSESHTGFAAQYGLPFLLLADTEGMAVKKYGVWKPNLLSGMVGLGTQRTTFVIDPSGKIARVYAQVKVNGHVEQVLEDLRAAQKSHQP